ncbi:MAG TPA: LON peptidase substrate-binding domain-containing protein, partial [Ktedonobacteraceae bacterium]
MEKKSNHEWEQDSSLENEVQPPLQDDALASSLVHDQATQEELPAGSDEVQPDVSETLSGEVDASVSSDMSENEAPSGEENVSAGSDVLENEALSGEADSEQEEHLSIPETLPVLPLKETVVYPFSVQPLGVGQERSIRLIDDVMRGDRLVVLVAQKSADIEQAGPKDIFTMGTVARVGRMFRMPDGTIQIAVQGLERVSIGEFTQEKPYLVAHVALHPDTQ